MSDLDDLLDMQLDDLEDMPSYAPFPRGAHRVLATFSKKEIKGATAIELGFELVETIELKDALAKGEEAPKAGDTCSTLFMLNNEYGRANLKMCGTPFAKAMDLTSIRDVIEQVQSVECVILTGLRPDKNHPDRVYLEVIELDIV